MFRICLLKVLKINTISGCDLLFYIELFVFENCREYTYLGKYFPNIYHIIKQIRKIRSIRFLKTNNSIKIVS